MRIRVISWLAIVTTCLISGELSAQTLTTGAIAGVVKDPSGAVLPGVTVEAASPALIEQTRTAATDGQGQYKILNLLPGTYSVTFTLAGFAGIKRDGIELTAGFSATVNVELALGTLGETLTVVAASPIVDTQNVRRQTLLSHATLETLPSGVKALPAFAALTLGANSGLAAQDVGGNQGESNSPITFHGIHPNDQRLLFDGMQFNAMTTAGGGGSTTYHIDQAAVQEVVLETGGKSAETVSGGVMINAVPKDGGNTFSGTVQGTGSSPALQGTNLSDELRARGLTGTSSIRELYDIGGGLGGPIRRNRLWFFTANRWWGTSAYEPGNYFNLTPHTLFYTPNLSQQAHQDTTDEDHTIRLTWQNTLKQKLTGLFSIQNNCICYLGVSGPQAPEAGENEDYWPTMLGQASWNYAVTSRLLLQAGWTHMQQERYARRVSGSAVGDVPVFDQTSGYTYGARATGGFGGTDYGLLGGTNENGRFVATYVTGSHSFKSGLYWLAGHSDKNQDSPPETYIFRNCFTNPAITSTGCQPVAAEYWATPFVSKELLYDIGIYAQDQWTMRRMTLNYGVRYDNLNSWVPAQFKPAGPFVPSLDVSPLKNLPNWKDINPRLGLAYDLFGNGKTALKVSLGRYVATEGVTLSAAANPANAIVNNTTRTWNDANGDFIPQASEVGPSSNNLFGTVKINSTYAPDTLGTWGVRPYDWQTNVGVQHQLLPGFGVNADYYHVQYGNFTASQNTAVTSSNFTSYCVKAPVDPRLPGGGGYQVCGLNDLTPGAFGLSQTLVTHSSNFGQQREVYNGASVGVNVRWGKGGTLAGGVSSGQTVTDVCEITKSHPEVSTSMLLVTSTFTSGPSFPSQFCHVVYPWLHQMQLKLNGSYPLPWNLQASAVYQNLGGLPIQASRAYSNAEVQGSLGRNLSSCGTLVACNATVTVSQLVAPFTMYENRLSQLDARLRRTFQLRGKRLQAMVDFYNIFNANPVLSENFTYGPNWLKPTTILGPRLFKFGVQLDF